MLSRANYNKLLVKQYIENIDNVQEQFIPTKAKNNNEMYLFLKKYTVLFLSEMNLFCSMNCSFRSDRSQVIDAEIFVLKVC